MEADSRDLMDRSPPVTEKKEVSWEKWSLWVCGGGGGGAEEVSFGGGVGGFIC